MSEYKRETFAQAGYKYVMQKEDGQHVLFNTQTKTFERWAANPHFAGYALKYKNTLLEFCSSYSDGEQLNFVRQLRSIQNFGEQHPAAHHAMMNIYRKYLAN
jgi:hypothetical protein